MSELQRALGIQRRLWGDALLKLRQHDSVGISREPFGRRVFTGMGSSHHAAELAASTLREATGEDFVAVPSHRYHALGRARAGDLWVGITHRGGSRETLGAMQAAASQGAFVVQLGAQGAPQAASSRVLLEVSPLEKCEPHTQSLTLAALWLTLIFAPARLEALWESLSGRQSLPSAHTEAPDLILGWGEQGEWLAHEAALKFMETTRRPVRSYAGPVYEHGPRHAGGRMSGTIWDIGRRPEGTLAAGAARVLELSEQDGPLRWVEPLLSLQADALAAANALGLDPDRP